MLPRRSRGPFGTKPPSGGDWLAVQEFDRRKGAGICRKCKDSHFASDCRDAFDAVDIGDLKGQSTLWKRVYGYRQAVDPSGILIHEQNMKDAAKMVGYQQSSPWVFPNPVRDAPYADAEYTIVDEDPVIRRPRPLPALKRKASSSLPAPKPTQKRRPTSSQQSARVQHNLTPPQNLQAPPLEPLESAILSHPPAAIPPLIPALEAPKPGLGNLLGHGKGADLVDLTSPSPAPEARGEKTQGRSIADLGSPKPSFDDARWEHMMAMITDLAAKQEKLEATVAAQKRLLDATEFRLVRLIASTTSTENTDALSRHKSRTS